MVVLRLRLGQLERKDLAERFRVSVATVSSVCRTWIKFMRNELQTYMHSMAIQETRFLLHATCF